MSLMSAVLEFIRQHPGVTAGDVSAAFPYETPVRINRAVQQLHNAEYTTRTGTRGKLQYTFNPGRQLSGENPSVDTYAARELITQAEELESRGLYQRAASIWLKAFSASGVTAEREMCLKRRKKCFAHSPCTRYTERMWDMAGRFSGDV